MNQTTRMQASSNDASEHFLFKGKPMPLHRETKATGRRLRGCVHYRVLQALWRSIGRPAPKRILDIGTGYGIVAEFLARRFHGKTRTWSIDPSAEVLSQVKKRLKDKGLSHHVTFKRAKAEALPFSRHRFDLVLSVLSLHHIADPAKGLREMSRVLDREGKIIVIDWRPIASPVVPHSPRDIPPPRFVVQKFRQLGFSTALQEGRYWYLVEATR